MADLLPIRKYIKVKIKKRQNRREGSTSYALRWTEYGQRRSLSLGPYATSRFAEDQRAELERRLNAPTQQTVLKPIRWKEFVKEYLDRTYPGHELPPAKRHEAEAAWKKSFGTFRREKLGFDSFERIVSPGWCHEITTKDRDRFVTERLAEVSSPASVDAELRALHTLMETAEEWGHRAKGENPFSGKTKVEGRRRRKKTREEAGERHYTFEQVRAILKKATEEATDWNRRRLRALVYFVAYTGARINEVIHLEWKDIDFEQGVAWLHHTVDRDLKTEASAAPFGLPDKLLAVLREWVAEKTCEWVFPNTQKKPWKSGAPGYRHFDQVRDLGKRAGVEGANWKRFRHTLATLGKGRFGMTREQVQAQLRHTLESTQDHYSHDDLASLRGAVQAIDFAY